MKKLSYLIGALFLCIPVSKACVSSCLQHAGEKVIHFQKGEKEYLRFENFKELGPEERVFELIEEDKGVFGDPECLHLRFWFNKAEDWQVFRNHAPLKEPIAGTFSIEGREEEHTLQIDPAHASLLGELEASVLSERKQYP